MRNIAERLMRARGKLTPSFTQSPRKAASRGRIFKLGENLLQEHIIDGKKLFSKLHATPDLAKIDASTVTQTIDRGSGIIGAGHGGALGMGQTYKADAADLGTIKLGEDTWSFLGGTGISTSLSEDELTITLDAAQTGITSVRHNSLIIGGNSQNNTIDFGTDDEILFDTDNVERAKITATGLVVTGNVTVTGDLDVAGGSVSGSSTTITTTDNMVGLASDNAANLVDIGIFGKYVSGSTKYTGIVWDANEEEWVIFDSAADLPDTIVNPDGSGYNLSDLKVGKVIATDEVSNFKTGTTIGTLILADASITDPSGSVGFGEQHIIHVGNISLDSISADDSTSFSFGSNWTAASRTCADIGIVTTADINGGSIDGTVIGASSQVAGTFSDLTATGDSSFEGAIALGNATTDIITVTGRFNTSLTPSTDGARDLGSSTLEWQNLYIDGTATIDTLTVDINATVAGTLGVTGESTLASATVSDLTNDRVVIAGTSGSLEDSANLTFNGSTLAITGASTISTTLGVIGVATFTAQSLHNGGMSTGAMVINDGRIEDSSGDISFGDEHLTTTGKITVGSLTNLNGGLAMDTDKFTVADSTGNTLIAGTLGVTGDVTFNGRMIANGAIDANSFANFQGLVTMQTGIVPDAQDGAYLGTTSLQWSDLFLADEAVISFGDDNEVTLTHVHNSGLVISSDDQLQFGDSGTFINQSTDGQLDIDADVQLELTSPIIQLVATSEIDIDSPTINLGENDTSDVTLNFLGTNDGTFYWDESYDHFIFNDDIVMFEQERIYFGSNENESIYDSGSGVLNLVASEEFQIDAPTLDVNSSTAVTIDTVTTNIASTTSFSVVSGSANLSVINQSSPANKPEVTVNSLRINDLAGSGESLGASANFMIVDKTNNNEIKQNSSYNISDGGLRWEMPSINYNQSGTQIMNIGGSQINLVSSDINIGSPYAFVGTPGQFPDTFHIRYQLADGNDFQHLAGGRADYIQNYSWVGLHILQEEDYLFEAGGGGG